MDVLYTKIVKSVRPPRAPPETPAPKQSRKRKKSSGPGQGEMPSAQPVTGKSGSEIASDNDAQAAPASRGQQPSAAAAQRDEHYIVSIAQYRAAVRIGAAAYSSERVYATAHASCIQQRFDS
jgi:hypothetical protein